jgi:hypothetical protein
MKKKWEYRWLNVAPTWDLGCFSGTGWEIMAADKMKNGWYKLLLKRRK